MTKPKLTPTDYRQALEVTAALLAADTHEAFVMTLVHRMHAVMNAAVTGYNETDVPARRFTFLIHPRAVINDQSIACWVKHAGENPVYAHVVKHPEDLSVYKLTDFVPMTRFRQTNLCRLVYRPMSAEYQICLPLVVERTNSVAIVFNRATDFTERDRQRLTLMQPVITNAYKQFRRLESITAAALEDQTDVPAPPMPGEQFDLTPRLRQVLALIVKGHSNAQIAKQLKLSVRTIEKYVEQVLKRMDVRSRSAAIAKAFSKR